MARLLGAATIRVADNDSRKAHGIAVRLVERKVMFSVPGGWPEEVCAIRQPYTLPTIRKKRLGKHAQEKQLVRCVLGLDLLLMCPTMVWPRQSFVDMRFHRGDIK